MSYLVKESHLVSCGSLPCLESKKLTYSIKEESLKTILSYELYTKHNKNFDALLALNIIPFTVVPSCPKGIHADAGSADTGFEPETTQQ